MTADEEDDKENHRSGSPSRCLLKQRFPSLGKSTWSTTPKEEAMVQGWVSQLQYKHCQPDMVSPMPCKIITTCPPTLLSVLVLYNLGTNFDSHLILCFSLKGDLINLLMSEGHEDLRKKLDGCKPEVRERFFYIIVEETEPAIDAEKVETLFHYESRVGLHII